MREREAERLLVGVPVKETDGELDELSEELTLEEGELDKDTEDESDAETDAAEEADTEGDCERLRV